ncbi:MAG: hypothetical protein R3B07_18590 [Polyangiaceae bacterium]
MSGREEFHHQLLSLAHELKNCLLVIQGSACLVQQRPAELTEVLELASDIDQAAHHAGECLSALQRAVQAEQTSSAG